MVPGACGRSARGRSKGISPWKSSDGVRRRTPRTREVISMRIQMFSVLAAAALAVGVGAAPAAEPVAMITDLQGKVEAGGAAPAILASVNPGATLDVADGAALVVVYFGSGKEF